MSRIARKIYRIARQVTEDEGGGGPRVFLVDLDRQSDGFDSSTNKISLRTRASGPE
jgi:hypothetical protein